MAGVLLGHLRGAPETLQLFYPEQLADCGAVQGSSSCGDLLCSILYISRGLFKDAHQIVPDGMLSTRKPFLCFDVQLLGIWGSVLAYVDTSTAVQN